MNESNCLECYDVFISGYDTRVDLNLDGRIDIMDLVVVARNFGAE